MEVPFDPARATADIRRGKMPTSVGRHPVLTNLADVQPERVEWLSPGRLAVGKITIIDGDPGQGKSTLAIDFAARITQGLALPDGDPIPPGGVVLISPEDGVADTIRPRFEAAGANLEMVVMLEGSQNLLDLDDGIMPPTIPNDLPNIRQAIEAVGARLLIIDPLFAALGTENSSKSDQDMRRALTPLARLADETGVAVLIIRHLNKTPGGSPLYRGGGSIGIIGVARFAQVVGIDPDDPDSRVLAPTKCNIGRMPESLKFRLVESPHNPDVARVEWLGRSDHTARTVLAGPDDEHEGGRLSDAAEWLRALLGLGPMSAEDVRRAASEAGHAWRTIERAKKPLGVRSDKTGTAWRWSLPNDPDQEDRQRRQDRQRGESGSLESNLEGFPSEESTPGGTTRYGNGQERQVTTFGGVGGLGGLEHDSNPEPDGDDSDNDRPLCIEPGCARPVAAGAIYFCDRHQPVNRPETHR